MNLISVQFLDLLLNCVHISVNSLKVCMSYMIYIYIQWEQEYMRNKYVKYLTQSKNMDLEETK